MKFKKTWIIYNTYTPFCILLLALINKAGSVILNEQLADTFFLNWYLVLVMIISTFIFAFHIFTGDEHKEIVYHLDTICKKYRFPLIFYFLFILYFIYLLHPAGLNTTIIQICFINFVCFLFLYTFVQFKSKELNAEQLTGLLIILGIVLRFVYTLYNPYYYRQHDVMSEKGHLEYIRYIIRHRDLPESAEGLFYHPPVHHIIAAGVISLGSILQFNEPQSIRLLQFVIFIFNSYTLILFYKTLQELNCPSVATGVAVTLFSFYPMNIYFASWLNNDNTMFFFYMLSFYFLVRWKNKPTIPHIILLSAATGLTSLTKKAGLFLLPLTSMTICVEGYKIWKNEKQIHLRTAHILRYLRSLIVFLLLAVPLSVSFQWRQYVIHGQNLFYIPPAPLQVIPNTWHNLFNFPVTALFTHPFPENPINGQNNYFLYYLFQTSLFGEWNFPGLEIIAVLLSTTSLLNLLLLAFYFIIPQQQGRYRKDGYIFLINMLIFLIAIYKFRIDSPFVCTQNFRYITPLLISTAYFSGHAFYTLASKNKWLTKILAWPWLILNSAFSLLFISLIGMPY